MRKALLAMTMTALAGIVSASAATLTPEQALARVRGDVHMSSLAPKSATAVPVLTQRDGGEPTVYVFAGDAGGYMVVSADDIAPALLGYSDRGKVGELPPALLYWIGEYGRQIDYARSQGTAVPMAAATSTDTKSPITPLTATRWNQDAPFNNDCPEVNGTRCVTGCVATALAQIMKYHNWPAKGTGSNSYTSQSIGQTLTVDFGNTTYDWANMADIYTSASTATQNAAVANLMYSCGVAVNMDYTTSESSATSFDAAKAMINYFGYDKGIAFLSRDYYGLDEWNDIVYAQLADYGPVQYSGQSNTGGHSFVCDGYSTGGYFHINWGWGGMSDGYFLLTALNPESQGIGGSTSGYNFDQDIIANVKPASASSTPDYNFVAQSFVISDPQTGEQATSASLGNEVLAYGPVFSFCLTPVSGHYGMKLTDADGNTSYIESNAFENLNPQSGVYAFYVQLPADLAEGTYTISPAVRDELGKWYDVRTKVGAATTRSMTVADGLANFVTDSAAALSVSDVTPSTPFYIGAKFELTATVTNTGQEEYLGQIRLMLVQNNQAVAEGDLYPVDLGAGASTDITYVSTFTAASGTTLAAGQYNICFVDANGNQISPMTAITLNAEATPTLKVTNFKFDGNAQSATLDEVQFSFDLDVTAGYFAGNVTVVIFPYTSGQVSSMASYSSDDLYMQAGDSKTVTVKAPFANGEVGKTYFAMLYNGREPIAEDQVRFTVAKATGVDDVTTDVPVTLEYYTLEGVRVADSRPAPGLYIVRSISADGSVSVEKILAR